MRRLTTLALACAALGFSAAPASADSPDYWRVTAMSDGVKPCAVVEVFNAQEIADAIKTMRASDWFDFYGCKIRVQPVREVPAAP